jgi:hypothetical protein
MCESVFDFGGPNALNLVKMGHIVVILDGKPQNIVAHIGIEFECSMLFVI